MIECLDGQIITKSLVTEPKVVDRATNMYDNSWKMRYNVTTNIVVTSNKIKLVMELKARQGELVEKGLAINSNEYGDYTIYEYTELNSIKPQMIENATKNARAAAEKFAKDSDSKLGKIKTANQGLFTIEDVDSYTPNVKHVRVVTNVTYFLED